MKLKNIYKLFALAVLFVTLQSRSTGPAGTANLQVSGAPGSSGSMGTCANAGCHVAGAFNPSASIQLLDGTTATTVYQPGKSYKVRVAFTAGSGSPARYGFQAASLNSANNQSGEWGNVGAGKQAVTLAGRSYVEHSIPSSSNSFEMEWIAPGAGAGDVTFYSAGIAANNNGGTSGDGTAATSLTVGEDPVNSISELNRNTMQMEAIPNPVQENLNLQIFSRSVGSHKVSVMDITGHVVRTLPVDIQPGQQTLNIDVASLPSGIYVVQLVGESHSAAIQIIKQ